MDEKLIRQERTILSKSEAQKYNALEFVVSKNIHDYKPIFEGFVEDFGHTYYGSILRWCEILDRSEVNAGKFWKIWLIKYESKIIGICGLYSHVSNDNKELWLGWFGVLKEYRLKGIASFALDFMKQEALELGCNKILSYIDGSKKVLPFYRRNGFSEISDVETYIENHPESTLNFFEKPDDIVISKEIEQND